MLTPILIANESLQILLHLLLFLPSIIAQRLGFCQMRNDLFPRHFCLGEQFQRTIVF